MRFLLLSTFLVSMAFSKLLGAPDEEYARVKTYLDFLKERALIGHFADKKKGEIEIVSDFDEILHIQALQKKRLLKRGYCLKEAYDSSRVGIVFQDQYWICIRDAVIFPSGSRGTYNRLLWKSALDGCVGVAVLPITSDGKVMLNLNYRHATRSWELELPRGIRKHGETPQQAALRELREETGLKVKSFEMLGNVAPDTGSLASVIPVFYGIVISAGQNSPDRSEAILKIMSFTKKELETGLKMGYVEVEINKEKIKVPIRDSFLTFALLQAQIRNLF